MDRPQVHHILHRHKKITVLDIVFFYYVLFLGDCSMFINNMDFRHNIIGAIIYFTALVILYNHTPKPKFTKKLYISIGIVILWMIIHIPLDGGLNYLACYTLICHIATAFFIVRCFKANILQRFVNVIYILSAISLVCWSIEEIIGVDAMLSLAPFQSVNGDNCGSYIFFHVIQERGEDLAYGFVRNSGFTWEPGRFASLIVIAFTCNIIRYKGRMAIWSKHNIVFLLALITTFSTTGYVAIMVVLSINLIFSPKLALWKKIVFGGMFAVVAVFVMGLSFMSEKISSRANVETYISEDDRILDAIEDEDGQFTVDRFEGMTLDGLNFIDAPWFGYGLDSDNSYVRRNISEKIVTSNGIVKPFAMYGALLAIPFFIFFFLGTKRLSQAYGFKLHMLLFIAIMTVSISYGWMDNPLMLAFALYSVFRCRAKKYIRKHVKTASNINNNRLLQ